MVWCFQTRIPTTHRLVSQSTPPVSTASNPYPTLLTRPNSNNISTPGHRTFSHLYKRTHQSKETSHDRLPSSKGRGPGRSDHRIHRKIHRPGSLQRLSRPGASFHGSIARLSGREKTTPGPLRRPMSGTLPPPWHLPQTR